MSGIDPFDQHLLTFVLTWDPFGGPSDEDTFPRFGLSASAVRERFTDVAALARTQLSELDEHDAALIRRAGALMHANRPVEP